jgi:hypothetical protein
VHGSPGSEDGVHQRGIVISSLYHAQQQIVARMVPPRGLTDVALFISAEVEEHRLQYTRAVLAWRRAAHDVMDDARSPAFPRVPHKQEEGVRMPRRDGIREGHQAMLGRAPRKEQLDQVDVSKARRYAQRMVYNVIITKSSKRWRGIEVTPNAS